MQPISINTKTVGNKLSLKPLRNKIVSFLSDTSQNLALSSFIINQALLHKATDIHIDTVDLKVILTFRIDGELQTITTLDLRLGLKLIETLKEAAGQKGKFHKKPWTGKIYFNDAETSWVTIHTIPFPRAASIIIRLSNNDSEDTANNIPMPSEQKIFIWQMGKVGSTTLLSSLKPYAKTESGSTTPTSSESVRYKDLIHTHSAQPIFDLLHKTTENFVIISMVRDIMARNISAIFQSMTEEREENINFIANREKFCKLSYKQQEDKIRQKVYATNTDNHLLSWYDNLFKSHVYFPEIDRYFIDVYNTPFDHETGIQVYSSKKPRIKMAIIRLENLNSLGIRIGNFMGIKKFKLIHGNISHNKWYRDIYQNFLERYKPTQDELDNIYNSKFMNYFYSPSEVDYFIRRWA